MFAIAWLIRTTYDCILCVPLSQKHILFQFTPDFPIFNFDICSKYFYHNHQLSVFPDLYNLVERMAQLSLFESIDLTRQAHPCWLCKWSSVINVSSLLIVHCFHTRVTPIKMPSSLADYEIISSIGSGSYGTCKKICRKKDLKVCSVFHS